MGRKKIELPFEKQVEVVKLIHKGIKRDRIAQICHFSTRTLHSLIWDMVQEFGLKKPSELTGYFSKQGWIN